MVISLEGRWDRVGTRDACVCVWLVCPWASQSFLNSLVWAITMLSSAVSRGVGAVKVHKRMYATSESEAKQGTSEEGKV